MDFSDKSVAAVISIIGKTDLTSIFLLQEITADCYFKFNWWLRHILICHYLVYSAANYELLTTEEERKIKMGNAGPVSQLEKLRHYNCRILLPTTAPLVGMLMLGNLFKECGVVILVDGKRHQMHLCILLLFFLEHSGATISVEAFFEYTLKIAILGLVAFAFGTAACAVR